MTGTPSAPAAAPRARRGGLVPALAGVLLALVFAPALYLFRFGALDLLALILAASGGVYWGVAASGVRRSVAVTEALVGLGFVVMAALGLWWSSWWLAAGFVLHGAWDFAHHPRGLRTGLRRWFPPFCAAFDWMVALLIVFL
jgi:uncharacterized protein DUF6010